MTAGYSWHYVCVSLCVSEDMSAQLALCVCLCVSEGMSAFLDVHDCGVQLAPLVKGKKRRFYLMVDEVLWDYAPTGMDLYSGEALMGEGRWAIGWLPEIELADWLTDLTD